MYQPLRPGRYQLYHRLVSPDLCKTAWGLNLLYTLVLYSSRSLKNCKPSNIRNRYSCEIQTGFTGVACNQIKFSILTIIIKKLMIELDKNKHNIKIAPNGGAKEGHQYDIEGNENWGKRHHPADFGRQRCS